jgi:hypothetical protein
MCKPSGYVQTAQALFERADQRLLAAKRAGRNRVISDDEWENMPAGSAPVQRLVERESAFGSLHTFLRELTIQRRGQLTVSGPSGVGRSAFLDEAQQRAQVHGFIVLPLRGSTGLRMRDYGALHEALPNWPALPHPLVSTDLWTESLRTVLA